jgi:beta-glucosidase
VANTGARDGWHVVQVYGHRTEGERAGERVLLGFTACFITAGQSVTVTVPCMLSALAIWNQRTQELDLPADTTIALEIGAHAHDLGALRVRVAL